MNIFEALKVNGKATLSDQSPGCYVEKNLKWRDQNDLWWEIREDDLCSNKWIPYVSREKIPRKVTLESVMGKDDWEEE